MPKNAQEQRKTVGRKKRGDRGTGTRSVRGGPE